MTPLELEQLQRVVALRMTIDLPAEARTWHEWTDLLAKRLAVVQMYTHEEDRPSFGSVLQFVGDAMSMLALLDKAEQADPVAGEAA